MRSEPTDADLLGVGYAPGDYMVACRDCGSRDWMADKRADRCRPCAVRLWHATPVAPPPPWLLRLLAALKAERDAARDAVALHLENKWSAIELALADAEATKLWMDLHSIKSLDALKAERDAAVAEVERLRDLLEHAATYVELSADEACGEEGAEAQHFLDQIRAALATLDGTKEQA